MKNQGKVVLFFPSYNSQEISPPLALVSLAAPLLQEGYEVRIIDQSLEKDYVGTVLREMQGALCLGISIITGPMINGAVEVGKAVKNEHPEIPIVLGGWHPSILPEQTLRASFVDVVALKQGEMTLLDLVHCFQNAALPKNVTGILWKDGAEMRWTGQRQHPRVAELPSRLPGYALIDYERYHQATGLRWIMYSSSHGCPYNCSYCSNASVYGRSLDLLPVEQVVDEVTYLVRKQRIQLVGVIDDIYFAFMDRCLQMAEGFIRAGVKFEWYIQEMARLLLIRLVHGDLSLVGISLLVHFYWGFEAIIVYPLVVETGRIFLAWGLYQRVLSQSDKGEFTFLYRPIKE